MGGEVLEKWTGNRGEKVDIGGGVEATREITSDSLGVGFVGFDQVDHGDVWDWVSLRVDVS